MRRVFQESILVLTFLCPLLAASAAERTQLAHWTFDGPGWTSEGGIDPVISDNPVKSPSFNGKAYHAPNNQNSGATLAYPLSTPSGSPVVGFPEGTIRLFYKPDWDGQLQPPNTIPGRTGPGAWCTLFSISDTDGVAGLSLKINPQGNEIHLFARSSDGALLDYHGERVLGSSQWIELILTYRLKQATVPGRLALRVNGSDELIDVHDLPALRWPRGENAKLFLGGNAGGTEPARGAIDEVRSFDDMIPAALHYSRGFTATVRTDPLGIQLNWRNIPSDKTTLRRRRVGSSSWTVLTNTASWSYHDRDENLRLGGRYEYTLWDRGLPILERSIIVGLQAEPVEYRGRLLFFVDERMVEPLREPLRRLGTNLVGDGWIVHSVAVPPHDRKDWKQNSRRIGRIKERIQQNYRAHPDTEAVYLFGNVPIPYSGQVFPGAHPDQLGAWPADVFYGDVDGEWTDTRIDHHQQHYIDKTNVPGDGKFDQGHPPSEVELAVGRVDFSLLAAFHNAQPAGVRSKYQADLMRQYLEKTDRYRHKQSNYTDRLIVGGYLGDAYPLRNPAAPLNVGLYKNALQLLTRLYGLEPGRLVEGDLFARQNESYLWGLQAGWGRYHAINYSTPAVHTTMDLTDPEREPSVGFYILDGSYFGDWYYWDNFLRATLATPNHGLAAMWARGESWDLAPLGAGEPLGHVMRRTMNNTNRFPARPGIWWALLGDPTLRMQRVAPPKELKAVRSPSGEVTLEWSATHEPGAHYYLYRSPDWNERFRRLSVVFREPFRFVDRAAPAGQVLYQVRAAKLTVTGSGSFTNLSQGIFDLAQ